MRNAKSLQRCARSGFTVVELLIVVVVIAVIATISTVAYAGVQQRAKNTATIAQVNQWSKVLAAYKVEKGEYPMSSYSCLGNGIANFSATDGYQQGECQLVDTSASSYSEAYLGSDIKNTLKNIFVALPDGMGQSVSGRVGSYSIKSRGILYEGAMIRYYLLGKDADCKPGVKFTNLGGSSSDTITPCRLELK